MSEPREILAKARVARLWDFGESKLDRETWIEGHWREFLDDADDDIAALDANGLMIGSKPRIKQRPPFQFEDDP